MGFYKPNQIQRFGDNLYPNHKIILMQILILNLFNEYI